MSTRVLITGANGFIGKKLCEHLSKLNFDLVLLQRRANVQASQFKTITIENLSSPINSELLTGINCVVHLAARVHIMDDHAEDPLSEFRKVNVLGTLNLARQAANAGVKRFVFISSIKVNGEQSRLDKPFTEDDLPNPKDAYGMSKYEAEQGLLDIAKTTNMEVVIIRPPLVYGPGVKANFASMANAIKRNLPLPLGAIHNKRSFVFVGNLVDFIRCCIEHPKAANQIFLVSDNNDLSTTELLRLCAQVLNKRSLLFPAPQGLIKLFALIIGKKSIAQRLYGNLQVDILKAHQLLNWTPTISVNDGLIATLIIK